VAATAILLLTMVAAGAGLAHGRNTITALNELSFAPNKALKVAFRFKPGTLRIGQGERLTFQEGHPCPRPPAWKPIRSRSRRAAFEPVVNVAGPD
jgi:hypothetical protein